MKNLNLIKLTEKELIEIGAGGDGDYFFYDVSQAIGTHVLVNGNIMLHAALQIKHLLD